MLAIFKEVLNYGQTKKAVCNARCPSGTDFVRIARCGPGATQFLCERMLAGLYGRREVLSRRCGVLSQRACSSSGLRKGLQLAAVGTEARVSGCASPLVIAECGIEVGVQIFSELLGFS